MNKNFFDMMVAQYGTKTVTSANDAVEWSGGAHCHLPSVKFYGNTEQVGTPTPDAPVTIKSFNGFYTSANGSDIVVPTINGIGKYKDEWDYVTGKGLRYIHKVELDGVSTYGKLTSYKQDEATRVGIYTNEFALAKSSGVDFILSTHFKSQWNTKHGYCYVFGGQILFIFDNVLFPTGQSITDWLIAQKEAGTPVTIYYAMAEPIPFVERPETYIPIPNDSGRIAFGDGTMSAVPFELTYITHS